MNGKELLLGLSYISPKYIEEAKNYSASQERIRLQPNVHGRAAIFKDRPDANRELHLAGAALLDANADRRGLHGPVLTD